VEQVLPGDGRWFIWMGERGGRERDRRMNIIQIMYMHMCKCKNGIF
jgi:hypothetical protein